ncbi:hypothetical protein [Oceanobacillus sp. AG]|uniref:hypothetical protein n=1 Tax=Oceanobacillus sp. AG TaxID=2681969 RepID=UPI0012EBED1C|nr:hypothetical protein [Oceanobacillus sp. AG]
MLTKHSRSKGIKVLLLPSIISLLFFSPLTTFASYQDGEDCNCGALEEDLDEIENDVIYIEGEEKIDILRALETNSTFENNVNHDSINDDHSIIINLGENDYADGDVLQVTSVFEKSSDGNYYDSITAFVDQENNEVLKLSYFEIDSETVHYKDFDEKGQLMLHQEFTYEDFSEGNLDNAITHHSVYEGIHSLIDRDSFWFKFACGFSGWVACYSGCAFALVGGPGGFALCTAACELVWGAGLC